jgi:sugar lactone lactonase YvrE
MAIFDLSCLRRRCFASQPFISSRVLLCLLALSGAQPLWAIFTLHTNGVVTQLPIGLSTIDTLSGAVVDFSGNLYVADTSSNEIIKIAPDQVTTSVLSITGLSPALTSPTGLAIDSSGNLYIADTGNNRIVEVSSSGSASVISTSSITLNAPQGVAVDVSGDIFISDTGNSRIVKVPSGGTASVFTITNLIPVLSNQRGIAVDPLGNLYIADTGNSRVIKVSSTGTAGTSLTTVDGTALDAPSGVAVGNNGVLYVADTNTTENGNPTPGRIVIVDSQGNPSELLTGSPVFNSPRAVAISPMGNLYVIDSGGTANAGRVQSFQTFTIDPSNNFTSSVGYKNVQLGSAGTSLTIPVSLGIATTLTAISVYTAGTQNLDFTVANDSTCAAGTTSTDCTIDVTFSPIAAGLRNGALVVSYTSTMGLPSGNLTIPLYAIADSPVVALSPGVASVINIGSTSLSNPFQSAVDGAGNTYVTNYSSNKVVKIPAGGGSGTTVNTGSFTLSQPTGVALDASGDLFIADYGNSRIIEVATTGTASLFAISGLSQSINQPTALAFDGAGNLYITDYGNGRMVKVTPYGQGTVLGTGSITFAIASITGCAVDSVGNVYIADRANRIVKVDPLGKATTLSFSSVGALDYPQGVAVDPNGTIYVMDSDHERIIQITTTGATSVMAFSGPTLGSLIFGLTADSNGNLLVEDFFNSRLIKINVGQSALTFANTNVGSTSSDSPKTATVTNLGDQPLILSANPTFTTNFSENASDTNPCTSSTALAAGTTCDVSISFTPQTTGSLSASLTVTDNTLNVANSTQQIAASGTGIQAGDATATAVTFTPTVAGYGQTITIAARVSDTTSGHTTTVPTGSVSFTDLVGTTATQLSAGTALDGTGTATLTGIVLQGLGTHTITASYAGVANTFLASNRTATIVVAPGSPTITFTVAGKTIGSAPFVVAATSNSTGAITYSVVSGPATVSGATVTLTGPGTVVLLASQAAAGNYAAGTQTATFVVASGAPTITFTVGAKTIGAPPFVVAATSNSTGAITYSVVSGPATVSGATVTLTGPGTVVLLASQAAAGNYAAGTQTATFVVGSGAPAVTASISPASPVYGQAATVTVTETAGGVLVAGATATVTVGGQVYTCATNTSGVCAVTVPGGVLTGGSDTVTVATGATGNATPGSFSFAVTVGAAPTTLTLSSSSTEATIGTPVNLTATVASATAGTPTGTVTFYASGTSIGTGTVTGGVASLTLSTLTAGANLINATYGGNANFLGSTADGFTQTVVVNFTISAGAGSTPPTQAVPAGGIAVFPLSLGIIDGFVGQVTMSASGLPPGATATFNPAIITLDGIHPGTTTLSITTAATAAQAVPAASPGPGPASRLSYGLLLLPLLGIGRLRRKLRSMPRNLLLAALGVLSLGVGAGLSGCGSGGYFGATPTNYTITVTGTSGALNHSTTVTLTIQ